MNDSSEMCKYVRVLSTSPTYIVVSITPIDKSSMRKKPRAWDRNKKRSSYVSQHWRKHPWFMTPFLVSHPSIRRYAPSKHIRAHQIRKYDAAPPPPYKSSAHPSITKSFLSPVARSLWIDWNDQSKCVNEQFKARHKRAHIHQYINQSWDERSKQGWNSGLSWKISTNN